MDAGGLVYSLCLLGNYVGMDIASVWITLCNGCAKRGCRLHFMERCLKYGLPTLPCNGCSCVCPCIDMQVIRKKRKLLIYKGFIYAGFSSVRAAQGIYCLALDMLYSRKHATLASCVST
jgi:hypothetical protein